MLTTVVAGYPKVIEDQKLRKTFWKLDKEECTSEDLDQVFNELTEKAVQEQESLGLDVISDGLLRWDDEVTYLAKSLEGFKITGLIRFFDTNVLYRQPVAVGKIRWKGSILGKDFQSAKKHAKAKLKPILTGPFTLAKLSKNEFYANEKSFVLNLAEALNQELKSLQELGAQVVHVNEPALLQFPSEMALFKDATRRLFEGIRVERILYFYFGRVQNLFKELIEIPVETVGFDFSYEPRALSLVSGQRIERGFLAGIVDSRNTQLEERKDLFKTLDLLTQQVNPGRLEFAPSANLEYLPLDRCRNKVRHLVETVRAYQGVKS